MPSHTDDAPAPPLVPADAALFLDLDGTLLEIAPEPEAVVAGAPLRELLTGLRRALDGALAVVSGRTLTELDRILAPLVLPAAGQHGLEWRLANGSAHRASVPPPPEEAVAVLDRFARDHPGTLFEHKGASLALHYRGRPDAGRAASTLMSDLVDGLGRDWEVLHGKMVVELRPAGVDKGVGIRRMLAHPPFAGRVPVFAGDDWTDEDGFAAVQASGGWGVAVTSTRETHAWYRLADPATVHAWLRRSLAQMRESGAA